MAQSNEVDRRLVTLTTLVTAGLCFIVVFAISVMGVLVWQAARTSSNTEQLKIVAVETHDSLCALKTDLERRHDSGEKFLRDNPEGIPGISAAQIRQSLDGQRSTLDSLAILQCSPKDNNE